MRRMAVALTPVNAAPAKLRVLEVDGQRIEFMDHTPVYNVAAEYLRHRAELTPQERDDLLSIIRHGAEAMVFAVAILESTEQKPGKDDAN